MHECMRRDSTFRPPVQMMLLDNLIHSDLHPGNILVRLMPPGSLMGLLYDSLESVKRSRFVSGTQAGVCLWYEMRCIYEWHTLCCLQA